MWVQLQFCEYGSKNKLDDNNRNDSEEMEIKWVPTSFT